LPRLEQNAAAYPRLITLRAGLAQALAWSGRTDEAAAIVGQVTANGLQDVPWDPARTHALARFTEAAVVAGPSDAYAVLYTAFEPFADQIVCSGANASGLSRTYLGMLAAKLGRHELADEHLGIASEFHRLNRMLVWEARSELAWAEALAERGETERGHTHASRALELARAHGYGAYEPRAAAILAAPTQPPSTSSTASTSRSSL
jgi:tetratricopeptide (TPR) repeat protein